jgi:FAD/FMN-containing dehydrogenase
LGYRWRIGTVQGAVATWYFVGADFRGRQVATAPCTVPFSEFASGITWDRLRQIKAQYDPTNLFHMNQNIPSA